MCGCAWNYTCSRCEGTWLDPGYRFLPDPTADEAERREYEISRPDFLKPFEGQR